MFIGSRALQRKTLRRWESLPATGGTRPSARRGAFYAALQESQHFWRREGYVRGRAFVPDDVPRKVISAARTSADAEVAAPRKTQMRVSEPKPSDVAQLRGFYESLDESTFAARFHYRPRTAADFEKARLREAQAFCRQPHVLYIEDGKLLGVMAIQPKGHRDVELSVTTLPGIRGRGVGSQLLQAAEAEAVAQHRETMWAEVSGENTPALKILRKAGFHFCYSNEKGEATFVKRLRGASPQ